MATKINYGKCEIEVIGMDMNCPLCGTLVKSGETHACERGEPKKLRAKKRLTRKG